MTHFTKTSKVQTLVCKLFYSHVLELTSKSPMKLLHDLLGLVYVNQLCLEIFLNKDGDFHGDYSALRKGKECKILRRWLCIDTRLHNNRKTATFLLPCSLSVIEQRITTNLLHNS